MRREDFIDLIGRIPETDHARIQLILRTGMFITTDAYVRFEEHFALVRGREAGQTDDSRAFFVPYDEVVCIKIDRMMKLSELTGLYGDTAPTGAQPQPSSATLASAVTPGPVTTPAPIAPQDPTEIAKQNLLERIRAARTAAGNLNRGPGK